MPVLVGFDENVFPQSLEEVLKLAEPERFEIRLGVEPLLKDQRQLGQRDFAVGFIFQAVNNFFLQLENFHLS